MTSYDGIVIGGGPSGLMAAGQVALAGHKVLLIEKKKNPGIKLLLTGKGRCNLSNTASIDQALDHFNVSGKFLTQAFYRFYNQELCEFFESRGLPTIVERGGRIFPATESARDVLNVLLDWTAAVGVEIQTETTAKSILLSEGRVSGIGTSHGPLSTNHLILACGGKSYPGTGSTGDGFDLASQVGHKIIHPLPALVPLITAGHTARRLQGLSLRNVTANLLINKKKIKQEFGELLFTHYGLSGPIILTISKTAVDQLESGKHPWIQIDLKPALDHSTLEQRLLRDLSTLGKKQIKSLLTGLLPKKLIPVCLEQTGLAQVQKSSQMTSQQRQKLIAWLKDDFKFQVVGQKGFRYAIITAGGVDTTEVDSRTMQSKIVPGLYFAGEILDVDGDTGGYNLQAAFSTGWLAGQAVRSSLAE